MRVQVALAGVLTMLLAWQGKSGVVNENGLLGLLVSRNRPLQLPLPRCP